MKKYIIECVAVLILGIPFLIFLMLIMNIDNTQDKKVHCYTACDLIEKSCFDNPSKQCVKEYEDCNTNCTN